MNPGSGSGSGERSRDSGSGERGRGSGSGERVRGSGISSGSVGRRRRSRRSEGSGDGSVDKSMTQRRRMSAQSMGTRLMPEFNAAAGGGVQPEAPHKPDLGRLLLNSSVMSPTPDDEVIVMDGVLVDNNVTAPRRSSSLSDLGFVAADNPGSGGRNRYGLNYSELPSYGFNYEELPPYSFNYQELSPYGFNYDELPPYGFNYQGVVAPWIGPPLQGPGFNMHGPPGGFPLFQPPLPLPGAVAPWIGPPLQGAGFNMQEPPGGFPPFRPSLPLPGATAVPTRPYYGHGTPYFTPSRATPSAASARTPPGFPARRAPGVVLSRPPTPPPPQPQNEHAAFTSPPKAAATANTFQASPPGSSASEQPAERETRAETEPPVASSSSASREAYTWPLTKEEDDEISDVLYGHRGRRRLPVFKSICPD